MNHLPCPFCGHPGIHREVCESHRIHCAECGMATTDEVQSEDHAWRLWDKRSETELTSKLRELAVSYETNNEGDDTYDCGYTNARIYAAVDLYRLIEQHQPTISKSESPS